MFWQWGISACLASCTAVAAGDAPDPLGAALMEGHVYAVAPPGAPARGLFVDLIAAIGADADEVIDVRVLPPKRALRSTFEGDSDLLIAYWVPLVRASTDSVGALYCTRILVVLRDDVPASGPQDLAGLTLGYVRGGHLPAIVRETSRVVLEPARDYEAIARMLRLGRLDGGIVNSAVLDDLREHLRAGAQSGAGHVAGAVLEVERVEVHLLVSRRSPRHDRALALAPVVRRLREAGAFARIMDRWNLPAVPCDPPGD